jgi:hypothetical protein
LKCFAFHGNSVVIKWNGRVVDVCSTFDLGVQFLDDWKHGGKKTKSIILPWVDTKVQVKSKVKDSWRWFEYRGVSMELATNVVI